MIPAASGIYRIRMGHRLQLQSYRLRQKALRMAQADARKRRAAGEPRAAGDFLMRRMKRIASMTKAKPAPEPSNPPDAATGHWRQDEESETMSEPTEDQIKDVSMAPRVTPADIENNIVAEYTFTADKAMGEGVPLMPALSLLTFCVLVLRNGFTVTGESACASPENFDAEIGRRVARANAVQKVWPLMGYHLRTLLAAKEEREAIKRGA